MATVIWMAVVKNEIYNKLKMHVFFFFSPYSAAKRKFYDNGSGGRPTFFPVHSPVWCNIFLKQQVLHKSADNKLTERERGCPVAAAGGGVVYLQQVKNGKWYALV